MMHKKSMAARALVVATTAGMAMAAIAAADDARQLGGATLTQFGAEKAGNKEGTIPQYKGDGLPAPVGFGGDPRDPYKRADPFAGEKPLFSITAQNAAQHADRLDGMIEMFKIYPNFRMDIYPSHRTVVYPEYVLNNTIRNATECKGVDNDLRIENCWGGFAFPVPKTGAQAMWNHLTSFRAHAWGGFTNSYVVASNGSTSAVGGNRLWEKSPYFDPNAKEPATGKTIYWAFRADTSTPARRAGEKLVLLDPLNMQQLGRRAYQYIPGQRRVKLSPDLAYDTPSPMAGGASTMDDATVFLGGLDRFEWKLLGKQEKYIMYNNFKLTDRSCADAKLMTKNFANPDCVRWELHRVWVVEGKLKPGNRHVYQRRLFYWDEDTHSAGLSENYDAAGKLYRVVTAISFPFWKGEGGGSLAEGTFGYDLQTGVWSVQGALGEPGAGIGHQKPQGDNFYSPDVLAGDGVR